MKQTKIVASISDIRCDVGFIRELYEAGVNVVRINTAHATDEGVRLVIKNVREVSPYLAILIDTKGPEIRTTAVDDNIFFKTGDKLKIFGNPSGTSTPEMVCVTYPNFVNDLNVGNSILFDDGELCMKVVGKNEEYLDVEVQNDGRLGSRKSVNVPGIHIDLPALTEKDVRNIKLAIEEDIDFIAHSFVRNREDVKAVQDILDEYHSDIKIISKIENQEGVDNIDEIIEASYGIMIARGDLGIEVPIEHIPGIQRKIIRKCVLAKKPVIVATQMLHSMIKNPRPTRAEVTDVANAIYYRTDALMLSGETASGKYPLESVRTMVAIAEQAEQDKMHENDIEIPLCDFDDVTGFLSKNAIEATEHLGVKCIITDTVTGKTSRNLSAFRGPNPVISLCSNDKIRRRLALSYGVIPFSEYRDLSSHELYVEAVRLLLQKKYVALEDKVAYLSGSLGKEGGNTFLEINKVNDVIQ